MDVTSLFASLHSPLLLLIFSFVPFSTKKPPLSRGDGRRRLPPSPRGLPILGHLPLLGPSPHRRLRSVAVAHGLVMLLRLGRVPTVVASSEAAAHEAMKTRDPAFASRATVRMAERLFYGRDRDMAFAPTGSTGARRAASACSTSSARAASGSRRSPPCSAASFAAASPSPNVVNLTDELISYTNAVISRAAFGNGEYGIDGLTEVFADFEELLGTATVGEFVPWPSWVDTLTGLDAKATRTFKVMNGLLERVIADHRQRRLRGGRPTSDGEDDHRDFVDVLLDLSETQEEAGGIRFDTVGIKAIVLDMFSAATDTTYTTLVWVMAELINHPDEMCKLRNEIRAVVDGASHLTEDHLDKLRYLRAVIKETLRLHAPVPLLLPRETLEDTELLGYHVPARTRVVVNAWAIGRDPATWERAEEFVPERFVEEGPTEYVLGQDFRYVPFGAGRRGCPGVGFAVPSIKLVLASLLYHFNWELPPEGGPSKLDMSELYGLSVRLKATLQLVAKPWSP